MRVWRRNNSDKNIDICDLDLVNNSSARTGNSFTLGGNGCLTELEDQEFLFLHAAERIVHLPGFVAKAGSNYRATTYGVSKQDLQPVYKSRQEESQKNPIQHKDDSRISSYVEQGISQNIIGKQFKEDVLIYPNPNNGKFQVDISSIQGNVQLIQIFNIDMNCVSELMKPQGNMISFDLSFISAGVYFVNIVTKDQVLRRNLIIQ